MAAAAQRTRVVGYIRVSTAGQLDGQGLAAQKRAVREYAKAQGWKLVEVYSDEGVSGSEFDRDGLSDALSAIADGRADTLLAPSLDRISRTLTGQEATLAQVWRNGGRVFTCDFGEIPQDDPDDPMAAAFRQMMGVFAELERGMIRARLRKGRREKAEKGGYVGGRPGYGYKAVGGKLVQNGGEQNAVQLAKKLRGDGYSLRSIGSELEKAGYHPRSGSTWHPTTVRRLLDKAS